MEYVSIDSINQEISRIALGTWSIGGWLWGGSDENDSVRTIQKAIDKGINIIDTAAVYGFGKSEEIVGKAISEYVKREDIIIATKAGLEWSEKGIFRNSTRERIYKEIDDSLERLKTDYIDIYQIHWPDPVTNIEETALAMEELKKQGKIRAIGVSNYSVSEMKEFSRFAKLDTSQPPYNLFERGIEDNIMEHCHENNITMLLYGVLCRGLLSGKITKDTRFKGDDIRKKDPKFSGNRLDQYLEAVQKLDKFAKENYNANVLQLSVRWVLDNSGSDIPLWGARKPSQLDEVENIFTWKLDNDAMKQIDRIIDEAIEDPVGPEFMAPPARH